MANKKHDYREKGWDEKFEVWRRNKSETSSEVSDPDSFYGGARFEKKTASAYTSVKSFSIGAPSYVRIAKWLIILVPVLIILYLLVANFIVTQGFEYIYDIGSPGENYLTPVERISTAAGDGVDYRNLTGHLVYFDVPIARGAQRVDVEVKFKDNFPDSGAFSLGARDQEEWHYLYKVLYNPALNIGSYDKKGLVYRVNKNLPLADQVGLRNLGGITVASQEFKPTMNEVDDYEKSESVISAHLRGKHTFYVYATGDLIVEVEKQDINWYNGSDELFVTLYDADGVLIELTQIEDDGVVEATRVVGAKQRTVLAAEGLEDGVYKLELSDFDGLISNLKFNSNKVVSDKVFLADNELYGVETKESRLYFNYEKDLTLRMITYHKEGLQTIKFNGEAFNFNVEDKEVFKKVNKGVYEVIFTKNDLVIESPEYFAFTPGGYFRPFKQKVVSVNSPSWIMENVDYLITDYEAPVEEGGWMKASTTFDIRRENLFVTDAGKLSLVFNTPHLASGGADYPIPVDQIKIKVHKPGIFGG